MFAALLFIDIRFYNMENASGENFVMKQNCYRGYRGYMYSARVNGCT